MVRRGRDLDVDGEVDGQGITAIDGVAMRFVAALNSRDAERLAALAEEAMEFRPVCTNGAARTTYVGRDGLRRWVQQADADGTELRTRVRKAAALRDGRIAVLSDLMVDGEQAARAAIVMQVGAHGRLAKVHWYITEEDLLERLGLL